MHYDKNRPTRFDNMNDELITKRWMAMRPTAIKGLVICILVAVGCYGVHYFLYANAVVSPGTHVQLMSAEYFLMLGLQIGSIFAVCFLMLAVMAFAFGRPSKGNTASR